MKLDFRFSNLFGTVYRQGNLTFSNDGYTLVSPVGNKITLFDLKNNISSTLSIESILNIAVVALNPAGTHLFLINDGGEALYINLQSQTILHRHRFHKKVRCARFSPDGRRIAVGRDADVQILRVAAIVDDHFNPFTLEESYRIASDSVTCLDWSDDSKLLSFGSADMQVRVVAATRFKNLFSTSLGGHKGSTVACFFLHESFDLLTVDCRGTLNCWKCSVSADELVPGNCTRDTHTEVPMLNYEKIGRHDYYDVASGCVYLSAAVYHRKNRLLVTGFSNGVFLLHDMPQFSLIHNLSVSDHKISSLALNASGDWLGVACGGGAHGQLLVWEWQSETYVLKQQGHSQTLTTLAYSPDGALIATGAEDGKVKIWSVKTGFCTVTFVEHSGGIAAVRWTQGGKALLSASLDGSVRAFDLKRYRNFRTLVTPQPTQLSCLAVDMSGDIVVAGARDLFDIYVWSLQNGRLLEILSGHTAPISAVAISSAHSTLASVSWDKTLRLWDVMKGKATSEAISLTDEALDVVFSPDGHSLAVVTMDSTITWFDYQTSAQCGSIETRMDVDAGRGRMDTITKAKSSASKSFSTIDYSADGVYMLAAGQSRYICLYHTGEQVLVKKFQITQNLSFDAVTDDIDRRKYSEFGNMALIDASDSDDDDDRTSKAIKLAGSHATDVGERTARPEIRVMAVQFSPTGRAFAACTTEGLLVYSVDNDIVFDPFQLHVSVTPTAIRQTLADGDPCTALVMSLALNQSDLIRLVIESVAPNDVKLIAESLPLIAAERVLVWLGSVDAIESTIHLHHYCIWLHTLLYAHGGELKRRLSTNIGALTNLQEILNRKRRTLAKICDSNKYTLDYILSVRRLRDDVKMETIVD